MGRSASASKGSMSARTASRLLRSALSAADGWDEPNPASVDEDVILAWLLALNGERAAQASRPAPPSVG